MKPQKESEEGCSLDHTSSAQEESAPPDGGWGWMVIIGAFIIMVVNQMLGPSFGIMFSGLLNSLNVSSVTVAWIFNFQSLMWNISQLFAPPLCDVFGWRKVAIFGAVLAAMSISVSAFASSPLFLFFSFSFLSGFGGGLDTAVCFFIVPSYFKKRRGAAMALMLSGVCLGQFVGPLLISYLQHFYGFLGATLILGSIFLHSIVGASLFQPVSWNSKKDFELIEANKSLSTNKTTEEELPLKEISKPDKYFRNDSMTKNQRFLTLRNIFKKVWKSTKNNIQMIKSYRAIIIGLGTSLAFNGYFNFNMQVPFVLQEYGYSLEKTAWCVSIGAICHMISRLLILFASDWKRFHKRFWYMAGTLFLTSGSFAFIVLKKYNLDLVFISWIGLGIGANMGLYSLIIIDIMGMKDYPSTFGITSLFIGAGSVTIGPLAGWIRDVSDSYEASMLFLSSTILCSFVIWLCLPIAVKLDRKKMNSDS